jgi:flagellar biosynthesis protein FliR
MLDDQTILFLMGKFIVGMLIFVRVTGMIASAPFFNSQSSPPHIKIMFSILLSIIITAAYWNEHPVIEFHVWNVVLLVFKEFFLGLIIGFSATAVFHAARMAGGIIDMDMGFNTATIFDRSNNTPTLIGEFKDLIALMIFLFLNGHHHLIEGMFISVKAIPLTTMAFTDSTVLLLIKMATLVLVLSVKMSAPVLVTLFLTNLSLALLARIAPQTNIFMLSFQMKISMGLIVLVFSIPLFIVITKYALAGFQDSLYTFIMTLYPGRI